jgi:SAM-dependent methyltransferase
LTSAWTFYRFSWRLGPKWFLRGVELIRGREWPEAIDHAGLAPGQRVLDIGSAAFSLLPLYLATRDRYTVHITDISESVRAHERTLRSKGWGPVLEAGRAVVEQQDARRLSYPDGSFDRVFAVSTIEHIGGDGDTQAVREFARVLRPGGRAVITVPCGLAFAAETRDEGLTRGISAESGAGDLFRRRGTGNQVFFQYRYDEAALESRLVGPSGLRLVHRSHIDMRLADIRGIWGGRPAWLKAATNWSTPAVTGVFVTVRPALSPITRRSEAAVIVLEKPAG